MAIVSLNPLRLNSAVALAALIDEEDDKNSDELKNLARLTVTPGRSLPR